MAMNFDAGSSGFVAGATSVTVAHTCTGANLCLIVIASTVNSADNITGATYNGVTMTEEFTFNVGSNFMHVYKLAGPATGTHNVVVSASTSSFICVHNSSFTGVDQTTPVDSHASTVNGSQASPITTNITVTSGGFAVDGVSLRQTSSTLTIGSGQTAIDVTRDDGVGMHASSYKQDATSMSWSGWSGNPNTLQGVVALKPAAASTPLGFGKISNNRKYFLPSEAALLLAVMESKRRISRRNLFRSLLGAFWRK